jgi:hypothetical protein
MEMYVIQKDMRHREVDGLDTMLVASSLLPREAQLRRAFFLICL